MSPPTGERPFMPDYGVDTPEWRALPWSWAAERLSHNRNFWFVSVTANGRPHAMPVWGVWDDDEHRLAFSCAPGSRKAANIAANSNATVATESTVECLSMQGWAAAVDGDRRERWIERYLAKFRPIAPELSPDFLRANVLVEFAPETAVAVIERDGEFATRATRWRFT